MILYFAFAALLAANPLRDTTPQDSVAKIATMLRANGGDSVAANAVAAALQKYGARFGVSPELGIALISVENRELHRRSRSHRGARGIMQVMPHWLKQIKECGRNLWDIDTNVCFGLKVFRIHLDDAHQNVRLALLRYNGCVRARGCRKYASIVLRRADKARLLTTDIED